MRGPDPWHYTLAPGVTIESWTNDAILLRHGRRHALALGEGTREALRLLDGRGGHVEGLLAACVAGGTDIDPERSCLSLLYQLERSALLSRGVLHADASLVTVDPLRAPANGPPQRVPTGMLRLAPAVLGAWGPAGLAGELPGSWARAWICARSLMPILADLERGISFDELCELFESYPQNVLEAVLRLLVWCGLVHRADGPGDRRAVEWAPHESLFHARTRWGYSERPLGKTFPFPRPARPVESGPAPAARIVLPPPEPEAMKVRDLPFAHVVDARRSVRRYAEAPITLAELAELAFRTFAPRGERYPYPSAGRLYPLEPYFAVRRCDGLGAGFYAYDAHGHALLVKAEPSVELQRLFEDAANAMGDGQQPDALIILAVRENPVGWMYGDLAYSLILKEVGAVFQLAALTATAMGLAACPLGCGDSVLFARLLGHQTSHPISVGELSLGRPPDPAAFEEEARPICGGSPNEPRVPDSPQSAPVSSPGNGRVTGERIS
jgi:oxazoline/thiazoline dehydrogenase